MNQKSFILQSTIINRISQLRHFNPTSIILNRFIKYYTKIDFDDEDYLHFNDWILNKKQFCCCCQYFCLSCNGTYYDYELYNYKNII